MGACELEVRKGEEKEGGGNQKKEEKKKRTISLEKENPSIHTTVTPITVCKILYMCVIYVYEHSKS